MMDSAISYLILELTEPSVNIPPLLCLRIRGVSRPAVGINGPRASRGFSRPASLMCRIAQRIPIVPRSPMPNGHPKSQIVRLHGPPGMHATLDVGVDPKQQRMEATAGQVQ